MSDHPSTIERQADNTVAKLQGEVARLRAELNHYEECKANNESLLLQASERAARWYLDEIKDAALYPEKGLRLVETVRCGKPEASRIDCQSSRND